MFLSTSPIAQYISIRPIRRRGGEWIWPNNPGPNLISYMASHVFASIDVTLKWISGCWCGFDVDLCILWCRGCQQVPHTEVSCSLRLTTAALPVGMLQIGKYICANCIFPNWKIYLRELYFSKLQYIYLHGLYFSKLQNIFAWVVFFQMQNTFAWTVFFQLQNIFAWIIFFQIQNTFARTVFFQVQNIHISTYGITNVSCPNCPQWGQPVLPIGNFL